MNLLLLQPEDFIDSRRARVGGRRLTHLREILQPAPGDVLRAGLLDGPLGTATLLPRVLSHRRFKPFIEDELDAIAGSRRRLLAHPGVGGDLTSARGQPLILALGPEGGFIPYEVECFRQRGFTPVSLGERILSVEVAVAMALGVLALA